MSTSSLSEEVVDFQNQNCIIDWLHANPDQLVLFKSGATTLFHYFLSPVHFLTSICHCSLQATLQTGLGRWGKATLLQCQQIAVPGDGKPTEGSKWPLPKTFVCGEFVKLASQRAAMLPVENSMRWQKIPKCPSRHGSVVVIHAWSLQHRHRWRSHSTDHLQVLNSLLCNNVCSLQKIIRNINARMFNLILFFTLFAGTTSLQKKGEKVTAQVERDVDS